MVPIHIQLAITMALTIASAATSIWLVIRAPGQRRDRNRLIEGLLKIAVMGAAAVMTMLV